jgi:hypothetical protein
VTIRDLSVGSTFKLFSRYKDGRRRPKFKWGPERTRLLRAYIRLRRHSLGPCTIEIIREPFSFDGSLEVVEHRPKQVTMVRDSGGRQAPVFSGMRIQLRKAQ